MALKLPIYMDSHATTQVDPRVLEVMLPFFRENFGNAASRSHGFGWTAEQASEKAREQVGALIGASGKEIVWTSGATESDNLAIKGAAEFHRDRGNHIVTAQTEHKAVLDTCKRLEKDGFEVTYVAVGHDGRVDPQTVADAITDKTVLVSIMHANNEIGTINPIEAIGEVVKARGILFHVDAVQSVGKVPFDVNTARADLVSLSAHKMYGPKGVGALYVRRKPRVRITALLDGGGHERGMRSGTLNIPGIAGFGAAAEIAAREMEAEGKRLFALRERLRKGIEARVSDTFINGSLEHRLPGSLNMSFAYIEGEAMLMGLKDVAVSSGSACTSASLEPSYVLRAIGVDEELAHTSIRFGLGRFNTEEEVDYVIDLVARNVSKLREMSPLYEMAKAGIDLKSIQWAAH
jgi:cysteine desulfurase